MSSQKPDYFIAHNGLPNILTSTRHVIRQSTTNISRNRVNQQKNCCPHSTDNNNINASGKNHKNKQNFTRVQAPVCEKVDANKRQYLKKSKKDLINYEIRASQHHNHQQTQQQQQGNSSNIILSSSQKFEADNNECNRNFKRYSKEVDNKYTHQRKYDNKIFRHDLPDRIVLPPLPI